MPKIEVIQEDQNNFMHVYIDNNRVYRMVIPCYVRHIPTLKILDNCGGTEVRHLCFVIAQHIVETMDKK